MVREAVKVWQRVTFKVGVKKRVKPMAWKMVAVKVSTIYH